MIWLKKAMPASAGGKHYFPERGQARRARSVPHSSPASRNPFRTRSILLLKGGGADQRSEGVHRRIRPKLHVVIEYVARLLFAAAQCLEG